jgi:hypothetical protein
MIDRRSRGTAFPDTPQACTRAPVRRTANRTTARVIDDHEGRQAGAFRSKAVADPRASGREAHTDLPRLHFVMRLHVVVRSAVHGVDERDFIDQLARLREHLGHQLAGLAHALELERARHERTGMALATDVAVHLVVERLSAHFTRPG